MKAGIIDLSRLPHIRWGIDIGIDTKGAKVGKFKTEDGTRKYAILTPVKVNGTYLHAVDVDNIEQVKKLIAKYGKLIIEEGE